MTTCTAQVVKSTPLQSFQILSYFGQSTSVELVPYAREYRKTLDCALRALFTRGMFSFEINALVPKAAARNRLQKMFAESNDGHFEGTLNGDLFEAPRILHLREQCSCFMSFRCFFLRWSLAASGNSGEMCGTRGSCCGKRSSRRIETFFTPAH